MKRQWIRPQLVIIERGSPGENVLTACKHKGMGGSSGGSQNGCDIDPNNNNCAPCDNRGAGQSIS